MRETAIMCLYDGDGFKFPALGFVHCKQLNAVFGLSENAHIFDSESVPTLSARDIGRHLSRRFFQNGRVCGGQYLCINKNSRETLCCVNDPIDSGSRCVSCRRRFTEKLANSDAACEIEYRIRGMVGQVGDDRKKGALHGKRNLRFWTLQVGGNGLDQLRDQMTSFVGPCTWTNDRYALSAKLLRKFEERNPPRSHDCHLAERNAQLSYCREEMIEDARSRVSNRNMDWNNRALRILPDRAHRRIGSAQPFGMSTDVGRGSEVPRQVMVSICVNVVSEFDEKLR
jgi:hypothetical protein